MHRPSTLSIYPSILYSTLRTSLFNLSFPKANFKSSSLQLSSPLLSSPLLSSLFLSIMLNMTWHYAYQVIFNMKKIRTINMDGSLLKVVKYRPTVTRGNTEVKQPRLDISIKGPPACVPYSIKLNYSNENEIENYQIIIYQIISYQIISYQIKLRRCAH